MRGGAAAPRGMNKIHALAAILLALCFTAGCAEKSAPATATRSAPTLASSAAPAGGEMKAGAPIAVGRSLIVTMEVGITVADVDKARTTIRDELERAGGYVADASSSGMDESRTVRMELRVPATKVRGIRAALGGIGEVTTDVEKVQDVTEERADLEARLNNARTEEKRVLEIMTAKTGAIHEVLEAEKELARIRESIERMEAQKRSLEGRIDLATVNVTLSTQHGPPAWQTPGKSIGAAARGGAKFAAATAVYAAMAFVAAAPLLLPIAAMVLAIVFMMRSRRRTNDVAPAG